MTSSDSGGAQEAPRVGVERAAGAEGVTERNWSTRISLVDVRRAELLERQGREERRVGAPLAPVGGEGAGVRARVELVRLVLGRAEERLGRQLPLRDRHRLRRRQRRADVRQRGARLGVARVVLQRLLEPHEGALLVLQVLERHPGLRVPQRGAVGGHRSEIGQHADHLDGAGQRPCVS